MIFFEIVRVAMDAIRANKMRSFLTMLGIVIGVGAVITMVAIGEGAQRAVASQIEALGANVLTIRPGQGMFRGVRSGSSRMTVEDAEAVRRGAPAIAMLAPEMQSTLQVEFGRSNANVRIMGTTSEYPEISSYKLALGRFFDEAETQGRRRVAVLGGDVPEILGTTPELIVGQTISIRNISFDVIGVFESKGGFSWFNEDEQIWIPLNTAQFRVIGTDRLGSIKVSVADGVSMNTAMAQIEEVVRREHKLGLGKENDFWITDSAQILGTAQETTQTFTFLLAAIAGVSLLVGGIGIMNIMLVSVTERTREIGVRKALGATRKAVLLQFLLEATVLCMVGGLVGIGFGFGAAKIVADTAQWNTAVSWNAVAMAVAFAGFIGIFFGMWPARRAAKLDPIVALRYE